MDFNIGVVFDTLAAGKDLDQAAASAGFERLMAGELTPAQAGALLMGLKAKGESTVEIAAAAKAALSHARLIESLSGKRIDTCGTGGDGSCSFNCSTATALVLAGMGKQVVKHGNRSISSQCGSADALEALGFPLETPPEQAAAELAKRNFVFLFAPAYHPAFKHVMPVRKELGCRTLFNLLGPLLNPARPTHQLLGVAMPEFVERIAEALAMNPDIEKAAVVHGAGGFDELTTFGPATVVWVEGGKTTAHELDPQKLGFERAQPADVAVTGKDHSVQVLREILAGDGPTAMRDMVALNVAACLHLLDGISLEDAVSAAQAEIAAGVGMKALGD